MPLLKIKPITDAGKLRTVSTLNRTRLAGLSKEYGVSSVNKNDKSNKTQVNVLVLGLGCGWKTKIKTLPELSQNLSKESGVQTFVMCNTSTVAIAKDIAKVSCGIRPSRHAPFVLSVQQKVEQLVKSGKHVRLIGHSFGGSVVSRVAENLFSKPECLRNISFYTVGSIYTTGLKYVQHVLHVKDVALKCSGLVPGEKKIGDACIRWIGKVENTMAGTEAHKFYNYKATILALLRKPS
jgi:hypothetical protein